MASQGYPSCLSFDGVEYHLTPDQWDRLGHDIGTRAMLFDNGEILFDAKGLIQAVRDFLVKEGLLSLTIH